MPLIIKILYGSATGNAQDFAEQIWQNLYSKNISTQCLAMDDYSINLLPNEELIIFIVSTSGNGDVPTNMRKSWTFLLSKKLLEGKYLDKLKFALLGLGDSSYTKYNFAAKKLYRRLIQLGAKPLSDLALADDQDAFGIDGVFEKWFFELLENNKEYFVSQPSTSTSPKFHFDILLNDEFSNNNNNYYPLTIIKNERVTNEQHFQETRLISLFIGEDVKENFRYSPGDVLMVLPENLINSIEMAKNVLTKCKNLWDLPMSICRSSSNVPISPQFLRLFSSQNLTLNALFQYYFDLQYIPKRSFIKKFASIAEDELEKERLLELCSPEGIDDYYEYCIYSKRSICEFLRDFPQTSALLTIGHFLDFFPIIRARAFSIASSPSGHLNEIQILVAKVKYNIRRIKTPRLGLCSNFLCSTNPGHQIYARISPGIFKYDKEQVTPYILIGPGTGVAPFRSMIVENEFRECPIILFFGCRNEKMDFYFKEEWSKYKNLQLFTAFSRDQEEKIYVQHKISENSKEMWNLINCGGAKIFIAGSAGDMPKQVINSFKQVFIQEGRMSVEEADKFVELMEKKKLIQYETWS
uniref:NADPH-dependent diflavin oxidoreductase 1 n=1 Tax=Meloidogyne incognita TaxID=6306 RepID=A0A914LXV8_MELIC